MNGSNSPDSPVGLNSVVVSEAKVVAGFDAGFEPQGVYSASGTFIKQSAVQRGKIVLNGKADPFFLKSIKKRLDGEYFYGGQIGEHYGHILLETFARLRLFVDYDGPIVFCERNSNQSALFWKMVDAFGLSRDQIVLLNGPVIVEKLIVPPPDMAIQSSVSDKFVLAYEAVGKNLCEKLGCTENSDGRPLYLSRSKVPEGRRYVFGERLIESILGSNGFDIVHMQELSIRDQIVLALKRKKFCGFAGTAFHNLLFASASKDILFLTLDKLNKNFSLIEEVKKNSWREFSPSLAEGSGGGPWLLSLEGIFETCRACGLKDQDIWHGLEMYRDEIAAFEQARKKVSQRVSKVKRKNP